MKTAARALRFLLGLKPAGPQVETHVALEPFPMVFRRDRDAKQVEVIASMGGDHQIHLVASGVNELFVMSTAFVVEQRCLGYEYWHAVAVHKFLRPRMADPP